VLPYYLLYLKPRLVLILNNILIYKSAQLRKLYKQYSIKLKFLLLYLPDYNLIKATFNNIKA